MISDARPQSDIASLVESAPSSALDTLPDLEKFIELDDTQVLADDYSNDAQGFTELEITAKYCRQCHVATQRLYHVGSLSRVCEALDDEHAFPVDLIAELAEDDDTEVRRSIAQQLGRFASCLGSLSGRLDNVNAIKLLGVAFMLIEDDCEEVIEAAESTCGAVASLLSQEKQRSLVIPTLKSFGESEEEDIRVSAAKTLGRLSEVVGVEITKGEILPILLSLVNDEEYRVREAVASALCDTFRVLDESIILETAYPAFIALCKDAVWAVRAACAKQLVQLVKAMPREKMLVVASETFEPFANDVSLKVRSAAFEQLGHLIFALSSAEIPGIFVDHFTSMAESSAASGALQEICAYNLPAVVLSLKSSRWSELRPAFSLLASSLNWRVRRTLACSLHEVAKIIGRDNSEKDLLPVLEKILEDTDEVKIGVVQHLADICVVMGSAARLSLMRLLSTMNCEDAEKIGNWRIRFALVDQILPIAQSLSGAATAEFIFPILLSSLHDAASVVREKAVEIAGRVLITAAKDISWYSDSLVNTLSSIKLLATSHRWSDRRAYANICLALAKEVEQRIVVDELLPLLVMLAEDSVTSVRVAVSHFLNEVLFLDSSYTSLPDIHAAINALKTDDDPAVRLAAVRKASNSPVPRQSSVHFSPTGL